MFEVKLAQENDVALSIALKELCKTGFYKDALEKAQSHWGPIVTWQRPEQVDIAIRLYGNLGGDRLSDAILLRHWRKNKTCPSLLNRVLYYVLNTKGPILANEFAKECEQYFAKGTEHETDFLGFKSLIHRIFKNYAQAELLLDEAIAKSPTDRWLTSLKIQLLHHQDENVEAKKQAQRHFDTYPYPYNLKVLSNILLVTDGAEASIALYQKYINKYQSAHVWFEYAALLASVHNWIECERAICQFEMMRIVEDKLENKSLVLWKAQIAIHKQELGSAIELLSDHQAGYWKIVSDNLKSSNGEFDRKVLGVPFLKQAHMTCAPTTFAALCEYWGDKRNSKDIADEICFDGTPDTKERKWLRDNNYVYKEFELEASLAYALIENDIPFALVTTGGFSSHIQAVIGFNKQVGTLYLMDPSTPIMQETLTNETIEFEAFNGARCIVFVPQQKKHLLNQFDFPAADLFPVWDDYTVAEERSDYLGAQTALQKLKEVAPGHRITMIVERSFAIWNNDTSKILNLTNQLLEKYPNQTVLLTSKYYCLRDLGQRNEGLAMLDDYLGEYHNLDVLGVLFDQIYDTNDHNEIKASALGKLKKYGGYSAYSHWSLANYYWVGQKFKLATEHYLYAYCMDETNSKYIESFFKASRYLKKEHEALAILKSRFNKYIIRSHLPAFSLYHALETLGQEHIGVDYLFEALEYHADNSELLYFLSFKLIDNGLIDKFESLNDKLESYLDSDKYHELIARKNEMVGDFQSAIDFYQRAFSKSPFIGRFANGYLRLLDKTGDYALVDKALEDLYEANPENTQVMDYIADWHTDATYREKVLSKFVALRPDYGAIRRQLIDVRHQLGENERALALAIETCDKIDGENVNFGYLSQCYLKVGDFTKAIEVAKGALRASVDNDLAFNVLMNASFNKDDKKAALQFVFSQIKEQVIFGDSAWNFWFEANAILPKEELWEFIEYLLNQYPHLWYSYSLAANFYKQYDELDQALHYTELGIERFPLTPRFYNDLGQLYELKGDIDKTIDAYKQALVQNPTWADVSKRLCEILEKHESYQAAVLVIENAIKHNPKDGVLYGYLADLLIKLGDHSRALEVLKKAVSYSTDYRWAWNQLVSCCEILDQAAVPYEYAYELSKQSPYRAHVWRDLAYICDDENEEFAFLKKAISCDPYFAPAYKDQAQFFSRKGEYRKALDVLDNTPWEQNLPIELSMQYIDTLIDIGKKEEAITKLKVILFNSHGYSYLWKRLFSLLEDVGNKATYIECCYRSVEQNKHDPEILCYVGENLFNHGSVKDKQAAKGYLKKAVELSPNEQYIVLTYVDCLIEYQEFQSALEAIEVFEKYHQVCYAYARKIIILCKLNRFVEAREKYDFLVQDKHADYWCLNAPFIALREKYTFDELVSILRQRTESLTKVQTYYLIDKCLAEVKGQNYKPVLKEIETYHNSEQSDGAYLALLEYWNDNSIIPPNTVLSKVFERVKKSPDLIQQLSNLYIKAGHYYSMVKLFESTQIKDSLPAFVYYQQVLALQMLGKWDSASDVVFQGVQQAPDNALHNLRLWHTYALLRNGKALYQEDLEVIDYEELIDVEKYVYSTIKVALALGNDSLENKRDELNPLLRRCQWDYQKVVGNDLAVHAQATLKARLKRSVEANGFWQKLKLAYWISNRF